MRSSQSAKVRTPTEVPRPRRDPEIGLAGSGDVGTAVPARERLYRRYATTHSGEADQVQTNRLFERDIAPFLPVNRDAAILDVGCGQGTLVAALLRAGYRHVRGVDASPEQVAAAHRADVVQVEHASLDAALEAVPNCLDVVIAMDLLEHLSRDELLRTLDLIARALRPGGLLLARTPNGVSPFAGNYRYGDLTHEICLTPGSIRQTLRVTGFTTTDVHPCAPLVYGAASGARWLLWKCLSGCYKLALGIEGGSPRGHVVTQNMLVVARTPVLADESAQHQSG
jgi:2-polyprenyl-3-methyl-5-hydroxy-6-metoxy-1,4-benzoquinol methylase